MTGAPYRGGAAAGPLGPLRQLPALAAAAGVQALLLLALLLAEVPAKVPLAHRLLAAAAALCLAALELAVAGWLHAGLELAVRGRRARLGLDAARALLLGTLLTLSATSILKYRVTGVHLKRTDLWFLWHSRGQILAEASRGEVLLALGLPVAGALLAVALFALLRWARRRRRAPGLAALVLLTVASAAGLWLCRAASPVGERFVRVVAPEGRWLARRAPGGVRRAGGELDAPRGAPIEPYRPATPAAPDDVVLVMLESLPWQRTPLAGAPRAMAPNLARLAEEAVVFDRAYTTSTHSDYAQMALLSSLHPRKYDRHDYYGAIDYPRTLVWDALRPAGYATAMFSCQNERWGNMLGYLDTPGLELLRHALDWPRARRRAEGVESKVFEETPLEAWRIWRRRTAPPRFAYLNFQATHFPYEVPPEAPRPFAPFAIDFPAGFFAYPPERVPVMLNRFHNALLQVDAAVGAVLAELDATGDADRTAVLVVADHGEAFYEHGLPTHGAGLHEEQVRTVLLMRLPGEPPRRVDEPVSLLDAVPALLEHLGLPPHGNFQGRGDVLDPAYSAAGRPLYFTLQGVTAADGVLLDGWKYTVNRDRGRAALFDLGADPGETADLAADTPRAAELATLLDGFVAGQLAYYAGRGWEGGHYPPRLP